MLIMKLKFADKSGEYWNGNKFAGILAPFYVFWHNAAEIYRFLAILSSRNRNTYLKLMSKFSLNLWTSW